MSTEAGIRVDSLSDAVSEIMAGYDAEAKEAVVRAVKKTAKATDAEIRKHITFKDRSGQYRRAFALKKSGDKKTAYSETWYVKKPRYRLTHLLENGHMNRDGTRARAFPHIVYGDKLAQGMLPEEIEKELSE